MSFELLLEEIASNVKTILDENDSGDVNFQVSPAKSGFGDVSCNAPFLLAKRLGKNPREIANDLAKSYSKFAGGLTVQATAHPSGYLNFEADWEKLGTLILQNSIKPEYGSGAKRGKITIEHTSVNPNKALHIGHVRNIVVGDTLSRILEKSGYRVYVLNYVDDSGLQIASNLIRLNSMSVPSFSQSASNQISCIAYCKTSCKFRIDLADRLNFTWIFSKAFCKKKRRVA